MMSKGELLTRITVWLALAGYAVGASVYLLSRGRRSLDAVARTAWTVGCVSILAHAGAAYHFYHNWSHAAAYLETARQTAEVTGLDWGGGLFINYALVIGWVIDVAYWRLRGLDAYRNRPRWLAAAWQGFLLFIIFNATVVFKTGPLRWIGLGLCLWLAFLWLLVNSLMKNGRERKALGDLRKSERVKYEATTMAPAARRRAGRRDPKPYTNGDS